TRHGCRVRAYKDVLAACPAMVGGQGPRSQTWHWQLIGCAVIHTPHHALLLTMHTDHLDWSLPAHRRGTLRGMDAA
ncbi:hypothetical protein XarCFBP6762_21390, partial [Xanthomonas arboricola]